MLIPETPVSGLEISDSVIHFLSLRPSGLVKSEMRLPPGVIQDGNVLNSDAFQKALVSLASSLALPRKNLSVIIVIPSGRVYLQLFSLPYLSEQNLNNAATLNLQMISPIPYHQAYVDWELLDEESSRGELRLIGAFSEKENIERIVSAVKSAGFNPIAVEPSIIALTRTLSQVTNPEMKAPHVVLHVSSSGMDFAGVKNGRVYFDYFVAWWAMYGGKAQISGEGF